jgi:hypothetical protein
MSSRGARLGATCRRRRHETEILVESPILRYLLALAASDEFLKD